jgi:glycosyltransferase involved in cell wall biosynthesis
MSETRPRIGVLVVAYNAITTLAHTLDRIPPKVMDRLDGVFVFDDHSSDNTYEAALRYKDERGFHKLSVFHNERNLRYGGNQKRGFRHAIEQGYDIVVLLHGDGQYAPEVMDRVYGPIEHGEADMVMGSRMMPGCRPLHGGMPLYKFVGNRILTFAENVALGTSLAEFHSGYRAYSCRALASLALDRCSNEWQFDTEIIIRLLEQNARIVETPIPTYYGDEICRVNGMAYAYRCMESVVKYRLRRAGLLRAETVDIGG